MKRLAQLVLCSLLVVPAGARTQTAEQALGDLDRFRAALGTHRSMNALFDDGAPEAIAIDATSDAIRIRDTAGNELSLRAASADASMPLRLLAAMLTTGPLDEALADSGFTIGEQTLGHEVFDAHDGAVLTRRYGTAAASVLVELGTSRPRQIRVLQGDVRWQIDAVGYDGPGNGWLPSELVLRADGRVQLVVRVTDAAREATSLAPLGVGAGAPTAAPIRFPRLPL